MYLKQAFRGNNKFINYILSIVFIFIAINSIGAIPILILEEFSSIKTDNYLYQNLKLISIIFPFLIGVIALFICIKSIHKKKFKDILTHRKKFDYKRAGKGALIWTIILLVSSLPSMLTSDSVSFQFNAGPFIFLVLICIFLLPFQTSFEELLFRGYFMQGLTVATNTRWVPLIVTSVVFGLMHAGNPEVKEFGFWMAMPAYITYGLVMGLIVVMDNGLEVALGMHFANNALSAMLFTTKASVFQTPALFIDSNPKLSMNDNLIMLATSITFLLICSIVFKWQDWNRLFKKVRE